MRAAQGCLLFLQRRENGGRVKRRCWVHCGRDYALCETDPRRHGLPEPSPAILRDQPPQSHQHGPWLHDKSWPHFGHQAPPCPSGPLRNRADHWQGKFCGCQTSHTHHYQSKGKAGGVRTVQVNNHKMSLFDFKAFRPRTQVDVGAFRLWRQRPVRFCDTDGSC